MADYPFTIPNLKDDWVGDPDPEVGDTILADTPNQHAQEIMAIAAELGTEPSGTEATVKARLQAIDDFITGLHGEDWHTVGDPGEPAYQNGWSGTARFKKDGLGIVWLDRSLSGGTNNQHAFTLPAGYRPASEAVFVIARTSTTGALYAHVSVAAGGGVLMRTQDTAVLHQLGPVSFRAAS